MTEDGQFETTAVESLDGDMFKIGLTINFIDAEKAAFDFAVGNILSQANGNLFKKYHSNIESR